MLIQLIEHLKPSNVLKQNLQGIVVDNNDPLNLGRVRVKIPTIYEGSVENLPWVYPKQSPDNGGRGDSSMSGKPEVNSQIMCSWPTGDVYYPQFDGIPTTPQTAQSLFRSNPVPEAPSSELTKHGSVDTGNSKEATMFGRVWTNLPHLGDKFLSWFRHDKNQGVTEEYHGASESMIRKDRDGNYQWVIGGNLDIVVKGNMTTKVHGSKQSSVNGDVFSDHRGADTKRVAGNYTRKVSGDHDTSVGGNSGMSTSGNSGRVASNIYDNSGYTPGAVGPADSNHSSQLASLDDRQTLINQKLSALKQQHDAMVQAGDQERTRLAGLASGMSGDNIG